MLVLLLKKKKKRGWSENCRRRTIALHLEHVSLCSLQTLICLLLPPPSECLYVFSMSLGTANMSNLKEEKSNHGVSMIAQQVPDQLLLMIRVRLPGPVWFYVERNNLLHVVP